MQPVGKRTFLDDVSNMTQTMSAGKLGDGHPWPSLSSLYTCTLMYKCTHICIGLYGLSGSQGCYGTDNPLQTLPLGWLGLEFDTSR